MEDYDADFESLVRMESSRVPYLAHVVRGHKPQKGSSICPQRARDAWYQAQKPSIALHNCVTESATTVRLQTAEEDCTAHLCILVVELWAQKILLGSFDEHLGAGTSSSWLPA